MRGTMDLCKLVRACRGVVALLRWHGRCPSMDLTRAIATNPLEFVRGKLPAACWSRGKFPVLCTASWRMASASASVSVT